MKIFVNARFLTQPLSGVQRYAIECSLQIKKQYREVIFLAPPGILHHDVAQQLGVISIGKNSGHIWEQIDLWLYMRHHKGAPLLHMCNTATFMYHHNFVTIHDLAFHHHPEWNHPLFSFWYNWLLPKVAKRAIHVFTVSEFIKNELHTIYRIPLEKIAITYNGLCQYFLQNRPTGVQKKNIILAVGSFNKRKNQELLIHSFIYGKFYKDYQLVLFGNKNRVFAATNLDEAYLNKHNIIITNSFEDEVLKQYYLNATLVVSLSTYEGFGIPVLEGLYYGCKVLCNDIPVYKELYNDVAFFCFGGDERDIGDGMYYALHNTIDNQAFKTNQLIQKFNYESAAQIILNQITKEK